jgi:hypothetical protein
MQDAGFPQRAGLPQKYLALAALASRLAHEWLSCFELLALLQLLGRFLRRHGFSPWFGLPPWAVTPLAIPTKNRAEGSGLPSIIWQFSQNFSD